MIEITAKPVETTEKEENGKTILVTRYANPTTDISGRLDERLEIGDNPPTEEQRKIITELFPYSTAVFKRFLETGSDYTCRVRTEDYKKYFTSPVEEKPNDNSAIQTSEGALILPNGYEYVFEQGFCVNGRGETAGIYSFRYRIALFHFTDGRLQFEIRDFDRGSFPNLDETGLENTVGFSEFCEQYPNFDWTPFQDRIEAFRKDPQVDISELPDGLRPEENFRKSLIVANTNGASATARQEEDSAKTKTPELEQ